MRKLSGLLKYRFLMGMLSVFLPAMAIFGGVHQGSTPVGEIQEMYKIALCQRPALDGKLPIVANTMKRNTTVICYKEMTILHSGVTRTPLWVAEKITGQEVSDGGLFGREDFKFLADDNLRLSDRAELTDYAKSGYDRGHLAPSRDFPTADSRAESFSLANIAPQNPESNRGVWAAIESATREMAKERGDIHVVTGTLFLGDRIKRLKGRVMVPTHFWKAIYDPMSGKAAVYVVENISGFAWKTMSIGEFEMLSGIAPFPSMPQSRRLVALKLPNPESSRR